ncbi:PTS cellobiose transporter subunit IIC [Weissella sagaensis]|uniref:PTS cellobiose transporter subunit IIC n=1 Tax=Weissella sagaensis TaxID=2559928 RepID=UPI00214C9BD4|nr:PTS cellobiose transporter subunit IIC [Weissella sagaensis]
MLGEQDKRKQQQKELSLQSMSFNRFLLFRYVTAGFFFTNLYWMVLLLGATGWYWLLPASLFVIDIIISIEQTRKYWHPDNVLSFTSIGYWAQLVCNVVLLSATLAGVSHPFYPFINSQSTQVILITLFVGILICLFIQRRVWLISHDKDRYLQQLKAFKASLQ